MRKISFVFLLLLQASFLAAQSSEDYGLSTVQRINLIMEELKNIRSEREIYLIELENMNNERKNELQERKRELQERIEELEQKEKELQELKLYLDLFGDLIDQSANYTKTLQKKLIFWRTSTLALSVSTITLIIVLIAK